MHNRHTLSYLLLTLTALFWSGNYVVARATHAAIAPMTLSFARWSIALAVLAPFAAGRAWRQRDRYRQHWWRILVLAVIGIAGFNSLVYAGLQYTTATNGVLLNSFIPILIVLIGWLFMRQPLGALQLLGIAASFCGVVLIVSHAELATLLHLSFNRGDVLIFVAVVCWAVYTVLLRGLPADIDRLGLLTLLVAIGWLVLCIPFALELAAGRYTAITLPNTLAFLYVGLFPSVLAYWFYNKGVADVGPARAGAFIHLMPAFGSVLAMLFLGETFHLYHVLGIALIFTGIGLSSRH